MNPWRNPPLSGNMNLQGIQIENTPFDLKEIASDFWSDIGDFINSETYRDAAEWSMFL